MRHHFFALNILTITGYFIKTKAADEIKLVIGLLFFATGVLFTGSFLLFQMKCQEILRRYQSIRETLDSWGWPGDSETWFKKVYMYDNDENRLFAPSI